MFHHFHGNGHPPGQGSMSAEQLGAMIEYIGPERILPPKEWLRRMRADRLRQGDMCLTFDDTLRCQYDVAWPVLREYRLRAFWFIYTAPLEGALPRVELYRRFRETSFDSIDAFYEEFFDVAAHSSWGETIRAATAEFDPTSYLVEYPFYTDSDRRFRFVRDRILGERRYVRLMDDWIERRGLTLRTLAAGLWLSAEHVRRLHAEDNEIGLHTHSHPTHLARLSASRQWREYHVNQRRLERILAVRPRTMAHPCNSYARVTLEVLRSLGVALGFRSHATGVEPVDPLEWPREDHANILKAMNACESPSSPATSLATSR